MAYEEVLKSITLNADSSLATYTGVPGLPGSAAPNYGKQYLFVKVSGVSTCGLAVADDGPCIGVLQNKPQYTNNAATVAVFGVSKVFAGAAVTAGEDVMPEDVTGRAIPWTSGKTRAGVALTSGGDGELISVLLA